MWIAEAFVAALWTMDVLMRQMTATSALLLPDESTSSTWAVVYPQCHLYFEHPVNNEALMQLTDILITQNYLDLMPYY